MWAVVWFKDGEFVDGRTVRSQAEWKAACETDEVPSGDGYTFYVLPEATDKMRREQPRPAVAQTLRLMREMRRDEYL